MTVEVKIDFDTTATQRILFHKKKAVPLAGGKGVIQVVPNKYDLILYSIIAPPGIEATITLTPPEDYKLSIQGHPIKDKVAQGKQIAGGNRFFRVMPK